MPSQNAALLLWLIPEHILESGEPTEKPLTAGPWTVEAGQCLPSPKGGAAAQLQPMSPAHVSPAWLAFGFSKRNLEFLNVKSFNF